ncbi:MAG TPA: dihydrolipoyl dehydrogenase [Actinomycetes bacterium]
MPSNSYDLVILGGGTGGYSAALRGAGLGLSVALVEKDKVGGTCLHRGCIPTKALLHAAELADGVREAAERWGMKTVIESIDYSATVANREDIVTKNFKGLESHLKKEKVQILKGAGKVTGPREVEVECVGSVTADKALVLASGSTPKSLPGLEIDHHRVITSDDALALDYLPKSVIVLGAGAVGVEFASFWRSMGAEVTVVEILPGLVPLEDDDIQRELGRAFKRRGINVMVDTKLEDAKVGDDQVTITVTNQGKSSEVSAELLLVATGRGPVAEGLGYERIGVKLDRGYVAPANWDTLETDAKGVYAVGDVLPPPSLALAHASFAEGMLVAELAAGQASPPIDYAGVPRVTYCSPEVASVGLTEKQAKEGGHEVITNRFPFNGVARGMMYGQGGIVKLVAAKDGPVLGVHLIGARVTELIAEAMLVYNWEALPSDVAQFIHPHPTLSEAAGEAYLTLAGRPLHQG